MSLTVAIRDSRWIGSHDYEPISDVSKNLNRRWAQERNYLDGSASDWLPMIQAQLRTIGTECQTDGWGGPGAIPISGQVLANTEKILWALFARLPKGTPAPDLVPENDGEVCISWVLDSDRQFSLSVGANGRINFAGLFGEKGSVHGWQPMDFRTAGTLEQSLADVTKYVDRLYSSAVGRRADR
jgi:hypothetical protein